MSFVQVRRADDVVWQDFVMLTAPAVAAAPGSRLVHSTSTPTTAPVAAPTTPLEPTTLSDRSKLTATQGPAVAASQGNLADYYKLADGKKGADLLFALHTITRTGHVDRGYSQARQELFSDVEDTDNDNMIPDLFTGELRGPINGKDQGFDRRLNTEHTWPQSKGATGIAQSDLHHLRPSDIKTNERRGSHPYGEVLRPQWTTDYGPEQAKLGTDALGTTVFEPGNQFKGDIARGLLYFYTRYAASQPAKFTTSNFAHELPTLLKWNIQDPVDATELLRNDAVQAVQGNRNPFIDHPEYVDAIDFGSLSLRGRGDR